MNRPLLCSGPAASLRRERWGFLFSGSELAMSDTPWQPRGFTAAVHLNDLRAVADLTQARDGLTQLVIAGQAFPAARLLGIALFSTVDAAGAAPLENYVRGADLVVAYEPSGRQAVRVDALWRAIAPAAADVFLAAVDLVVSVRTDVLDSRPELPVQSTVPAGEVLQLQGLDPVAWTALALPSAAALTIGPGRGTGCVLFRLPGCDLTYVEMVHPADFQYDELRRDECGGQTVQIAHRLFRTSLEKGVILRARVRGIFLKRQGDTQCAAECYAAFAGADPPLGT